MVDTPTAVIKPCESKSDTALIVTVALSICVPCAVKPDTAEIVAVATSI